MTGRRRRGPDAPARALAWGVACGLLWCVLAAQVLLYAAGRW